MTLLQALPPIPTEYLQGGAAGLLAIVVLLICFGWLVPRAYYRQVVQERDYWRNIAMKAVEQSDELLPAAQITTQVARALAVGTSNAVERALSGMPPNPDETRPA